MNTLQSEKEKMLAGLPYKAMDKQLMKERIHAKELLHDFNQTRPTQTGERHKIIQQLFGKTQRGYWLEPPFHCDYGYNIAIGENFFANYNCTILDCAKVHIGNNVMLGPNVSLFTAAHPIDASLRSEGWEHALPITLGNNVWIGGNTVINPGVTIGENTVIGSGSVVTKDIPANTIAVGNPCKVLRAITEEDKTHYFAQKLK